MTGKTIPPVQEPSAAMPNAIARFLAKYVVTSETAGVKVSPSARPVQTACARCVMEY